MYRGKFIIQCTTVVGLTLIAGYISAVLFDWNGTQRPLAITIWNTALAMDAAWIVLAGIVVARFWKRKPLLLATVLFFTVLVPSVLWATGVRWDLFIRIPAGVSENGSPLPEARVYEGFFGRKVIAIPSKTSGYRFTYFYAPDQNDVFLCDESLFHTYLAGSFEIGRLEKGKDEYFCRPSEKELDPPLGKAAISLGLIVDGDSLAFNTVRGLYFQRRIEVHK